MKKIQKEVKIYETIYVSKDGKEFKTEADCKTWEDSYNGTLSESWKKFNKKEINPCNIGIPGACEDCECYAIRPKNLDEITFINAYINSSTYQGAVTLTAEQIGKLIILNFGYDHDYCDWYVLEDHLSKLCIKIQEIENMFNKEDE